MARRSIAVEGYVDVIAMVSAGYPATVAPLGTALTEDQLGLLWKMADEPVLCFDGDSAGLRAAYRAVDLAMPRLKPGKSLQICAAAAGAGPRRPGALGRARGGRRSDRRGAAARRHAVGARDRGGIPSTRRSGAPRSKRASTRSPRRSPTRRCGKYYRQDFSDAPVAVLCAGAQRAPRARRAATGASRAAGGNWRERRNNDWPRRDQPRTGGRSAALRGGEPAARIEPGASRPPHRGAAARGADLAGGAQPSLAAARSLEELASLEFRHADAERLKAALIDIAAHAGHAAASIPRRCGPNSPPATWPR